MRAEWEVARNRVYSPVEHGITARRFVISVSTGFHDEGPRVPDSEAEALAQHIARLLNEHPFTDAGGPTPC